MDLNTFKHCLLDQQPPANLPVYLAALWYDGKGNWDKAHALIDQLPGRDAARLHAYLHRVEGDAGNAAYWYRQAGQPPMNCPLEEEWALLVQYFLK